MEVSFEWADGPNANAAFHSLYVFSPEGEKIEPRKETIKFHKKGQWSYSDLRVFVPSGSIVIQIAQNTHGRRENRIWLAETGRPEIFVSYGNWSSFKTWPELKLTDVLAQENFKKILRQFVRDDIIAAWEMNASIESI